ncbi:mph1, partial [Symbiodinium sp. KB8]
VYLVQNPQGSTFALKRVATESVKQLEAFQNEVVLLQQLRDRDNVIQVVDAEVDRERGRINIVMEAGDMDLGRFLQSQPRLTLSQIQHLWKQMLEAVQVIHQERIVHSDLKPGNFLLISGRLKVIDFGIAKRISNDTTNIQRDTSVGTLSYMAPEAVKQGQLKLGRASDIWSLGIILYQMVYGTPPLAHLDPMQRLLRLNDPVLRIEFPPGHLLEGQPAASKALLEVLGGCLQRDPRRRPSLSELLAHRLLYAEALPLSITRTPPVDEEAPGPLQERPAKNPEAREPAPSQDEAPARKPGTLSLEELLPGLEAAAATMFRQFVVAAAFETAAEVCALVTGMRIRAFHASWMPPGAPSTSPQLLERLQQALHSTSGALHLATPEWHSSPQAALDILRELKKMRRDDLGCQLAKTLSDRNLGLQGFALSIGMAARAREWQLALHLFGAFSEKLDPSVVCCNAAISSCEKGGQWKIALHLFSSMPELRLAPNIVSYNAIISSCHKGQRWQLALQLFGLMPTARLSPDVVSYSAAAGAFEKGRQWQLALQTFGSMLEAQISPDVISYSAAISASEKGAHWQLALQLFGSMPEAKVAPNVISYSSALSSCEKGAEWQQALILFDSMPRVQVTPNVISYSAVISSCEKAGKWELAMHVFHSMPEAKLQPDLINYNAAISACEKGGQCQLALRLFRSLPKAELSPNVISYNAAVSSCEKGMEWQIALQLFDSMPQARLTPDAITFNASITACEMGGEWQLALHLFHAMPAASIAPNVSSYNATMNACDRGRQWQMALELFNAMA